MSDAEIKTKIFAANLQYKGNADTPVQKDIDLKHLTWRYSVELWQLGS